MKRMGISIGVCLLAVACGGAPDGSTGADPASYTEMNFEQRAAFMTEVVVPQMKETFVAFDPKFATLTCTTCHGDGATSGSFAMPNAQIPRLPSSEEAFGEYVKDPEHARWSQFMMDKVWPKMAGMLQIPMFDPATQMDGFSCHNCHKVEGEI